MSVIKQNWQSYAKLKYDLSKEYSTLTESHAKEMSNLKATLAQGGLTTDDPTYSLRVNKLLTDQMEAQESVTAVRDELSSGAIKAVLTDPYYEESYGKYVQGLTTEAKRKAQIEADAPRIASGELEQSYAPSGTTSYKGSINYLTQNKIEFQGMEEFYTEKYGEYTAPIEEVRAEKSAASLAQARGVAGGQMSKTRKLKSTGTSVIGGNKFLGTSSSLGSDSQGWWN